ncbi:phage tail tape measure protein [Gallibacterium anatis]|uniref:phage tail tape measure protein n=1 Tax=Gallibacterium anatis TaxID=750 RepID=UPI0030057317
MASNLSIALMIGASVGGAMAGIKRLQNTLHTLRDSTLTTTAKLKSLAGTTALGLTGAISGIKATSGIVMNVAEPAIKFESAMADVKKVVDFKTPEGFKKLSDDLLKLTRTLPMTGEELAAIAASGGQLGVAEEDIKSFTTTIAKMSVAFDMPAEDSGDAMAKLANVYKIPINEIGKLGDAINELSNSSPAKASDIVSTLGRIGGVAKQFGLTENAAAALANSFISLGKAPEVAGTAINGMLTKLMTADKGGKKFQAALASVGVSAKQLKADIAKNGEQALVSFLERIQKMPKAMQMGILVDLFGLEYADDVAVLAGNTKVLKDSLKTLQETDENGKPKYLGSMEKEFSARAATTENGLQLLKNSVTEFWAALGAKLLPVINLVSGKLAGLMHWITDLITKNSWLADTFLYLGGAIAGIFTGFSALTAVIGGVSMGWVVMSKPILKTVGLFRTLLGWGQRLIALLPVLGGKILSLAKVLGGALVKGITLAGKALLFLGRAMLTNPIGLAITAIALGAYLIYQYWEPIKGFFSDLLANIQSFFHSGIGNITATILNWSPLGLFYKVFSGVLSWFGVDLPNNFTEFGKNIINGLVNGINQAWESAKQTVSELGDSVKNWFTEKLGIHSPSRVFMGYGENTVDGLVIGVAKSAMKVANAVSGMGEKMQQAMPKALSVPAIETALALTNKLPQVTSVKTAQSTLSAKTKSTVRKHTVNRAAADAATAALTASYLPSSLRQSVQQKSKPKPLQEALQQRNVAVREQTKDNAITVTFNPTINVNGASGQGVIEQVQQGLQMSLREFEQIINRVVDQKMRRTY